MVNQSSFASFTAQQAVIEKIRQTQPRLLELPEMFVEENYLPEIGVGALPADRHEAYLRLYPQDFVVEEVMTENQASYIEPDDQLPARPPKKMTLYADLVKVGMSTLSAVERLEEEFNLHRMKIGFAGIKDSNALTSQRISLSKTDYEDIKNKNFSGFFLTRFSYAPGRIVRSNLLGNRFTIMLRTGEAINSNWLKSRLKDIRDNGFLNYYQVQRFGGDKLLSHELGRLILQGNYEGAVKHYLLTAGRFEMKLLHQLKAEASAHYGNWRKLAELFSVLPYSLKQELEILQTLIRTNGNFIAALSQVNEQTTLWVYAYASLLFNRYLTDAADNNRPLPTALPLVTSNVPEEISLYRHWLEADNIKNISAALAPFDFIKLMSRPTPTRIYPKDIMAMTVPEGAIIHFLLGKGAYATTFLANLFRLREGLPVPNWVQPATGDIKALLGIGTVQPALDRLKDYVLSSADQMEFGR